MSKKSYLGDSVYADIDPHTGDLVLTTENGIEPTNQIVLEPFVWQELVEYVKRQGAA